MNSDIDSNNLKIYRKKIMIILYKLSNLYRLEKIDEEGHSQYYRMK